MKKNIIILAIVLVIAVGGYYIAEKNKAQAPASENSGLESQDQQQAAGDQGTNSTTPSGLDVGVNVGTPPPAGSQFSSGEGEVPAPDIQVVEITYDGQKFTPASVDIKAGDYVFFKNNSKSDFWPASAPHPTHTNYPEFDAKKPIAPGAQYKFQFTKVGNWAFHDHLNPTSFGKVNVAQ